jgi:hypothetical protein
MPDSYGIRNTSKKTAEVEDIWLNPPDDPDKASTRRILRVQLVDNAHSDEARVKATVLHQRRQRRNESWTDVEAFSLARVRSGEEVRLALNSWETLHLYRELERLHALAAEGIPQQDSRFEIVNPDEVTIVRGRERQLVEQLLIEAGEDFWQILEDLQPDLFRAVALAKLHEVREHAIAEFERRLKAAEWAEDDWQEFFEVNTWIFGYGLSYRFLSTLQAQPNYGGKDVRGSGGQRGDFLTASEAENRFTVLVEIKTPETTLVADRTYRNRVHLLGGHLIGGVSQLQANCRTWDRRAEDAENREALEDVGGAYTIEPKGILLIGHTEQLDSLGKRTTFELFRRSLHNPEVITFDELLARARHLLLNEEEQLKRLDMSS